MLTHNYVYKGILYAVPFILTHMYVEIEVAVEAVAIGNAEEAIANSPFPQATAPAPITIVQLYENVYPAPYPMNVLPRPPLLQNPLQYPTNTL